MDSSKKKLESKTKCALKIKTPKLFDESGNKTLPSPSNIMNIGIMNVYTNKTLAFSPNFDGLDCVSEFHNLYNNKKKESAFEVAISRVESLQENIFESGNLDDLMDGNSEKNSALKVLPCFFGVNNSQESKSKITKINDINVVYNLSFF